MQWGRGRGEWLLLFANVVNDVICCDVKMSKKSTNTKK